MAKVLGEGGARSPASAARRACGSASASRRCGVTTNQSASIVADARRRARTHNAGRRFVEQGLFDALARSSRRDDVNAADVRDRTRRTEDVRAALDWMWPVLTPAQLLHDLFGSRALLRSAGGQRSARRRARCALPRAVRVGRRRRVHQRRRAVARRGTFVARSRARAGAAATPTTTRSAPTATSSSTKHRTCRRCSCGCSGAGRSTAR